MDDPVELSEDEVFDNDIDPLEGIAAYRKENGDQVEAAIEEEIAENDSSSGKEENQESEDDRKIRLEEETDKEQGKVKTEADEEIATDKSAEKEEDSGDEEKSEEEEGTAPEIKTHSFKADGKDFNFTEAEMIEQFEGVFGKAMNYTQKMQKIAPFRKMITALEQQGVTQDQLNTALDAIGGNKDAIRKLAQDNEIDLGDLSFDEESTKPYTPKEYGKNDLQIQVEEIEADIGKDPEYETTVDIIDKQWDDASRKLIADNPGMIRALHSDVKTGVYAEVAPEAEKLKMLDTDGNSKSNLDYYLLAGQKLKAAAESREAEKANPQIQADKLNGETQEIEDKFNKGSSEADAKRAAASSGAKAGEKGVIDYLNDDNDEDYDAWYKKTMDKI